MAERSEQLTLRSDNPAEQRIASMLQAMQQGDRQAAAEFVTTYGDRIRRRIRGKMGAAMRRVFDSQEILSTLGRRLDSVVANGQLRAQDEQQLWHLIMTIATHAIVDKARLFQRLARVESADGELATRLRQRIDPQCRSEIEIEEQIAIAMEQVSNPIDRTILLAWLHDEQRAQTAQNLNVSQAMLRKRWQRIRETIIAALSSDADQQSQQSVANHRYSIHTHNRP